MQCLVTAWSVTKCDNSHCGLWKSFGWCVLKHDNDLSDPDSVAYVQHISFDRWCRYGVRNQEKIIHLRFIISPSHRMNILVFEVCWATSHDKVSLDAVRITIVEWCGICIIYDFCHSIRTYQIRCYDRCWL